MSISDYERRKLLEKAAKLKAEKEDGSSFPTPLNLQQVQDRKMDQRLEKTQVAAKATAQATSGFAKELAAKTAKLAQEQAQRAKAKADAWRQAQDAKRTEHEEVNRIQNAELDREEQNPAIENTAVANPQALSKPTFKILASIAVFTALLGAGVWFWTQHESEKTPELRQVDVPSTLPVAPAPQVQEAPKASEPVQVIEPVHEMSVTPSVEEQPKSVEPKLQKVDRSPAPIAIVRAPKKRSEMRQQIEQPNTKGSDWVDKANNDLDHFAEQLK
ncbi:hypothetical protein [Stenotrophomonas sp.]|uniref:hypothetical protein n=1 Tax=Stenotrophomonas TaxID=40323 RepID=UPI0025D619CD|nr:hypothetical protein [Stenotrophomonas sp.]MBW8375008.1 hypothetical protein [Stenotrophomonas sp.]